jgi:hypothetical protein
MVMEMYDILIPDVEIWDLFNREEDSNRAVMDFVHIVRTMEHQIDDVVHFCNRG